MQQTDEFNLSHIEPCTHIYGPGARFTLWLQGCTLGCKGCWNTKMWSHRPNTLVKRDELLQQIINTQGIDGVTLLGGEPMEQADNTLWLIEQIRKNSDLTIMLYTGFESEELKQLGYWQSLQLHTDLIITGRYQKHTRNTFLQWRGSDNQELIYPTHSRLTPTDNAVNEIEIIISESGQATILGYPDTETIPILTKVSN